MGHLNIKASIEAIKEIINENNVKFIQQLFYYGKEKLCLKEYQCKYQIYLYELENIPDEEYKQSIISNILNCDNTFLKKYIKFSKPETT